MPTVRPTVTRAMSHPSVRRAARVRCLAHTVYAACCVSRRHTAACCMLHHDSHATSRCVSPIASHPSVTPSDESHAVRAEVARCLRLTLLSENVTNVEVCLPSVLPFAVFVSLFAFPLPLLSALFVLPTGRRFCSSRALRISKAAYLPF
jgi:hypothetical protein